MKGQKLETWIGRLAQQDLPIFSRTAQAVTGIASKEQSSLSELARVVLQDVAMTSRVLKLANTTYYNAGRNNTSTVSRALMVIGFDAVRDICLSYMLIESVLKGAKRERMVRELARSFHAAVQAKQLAVLTHDKSIEEVFIASLLYRLGNVAFNCFGGALADELESEADKDEAAQDREKRILGFGLQELTRALNQRWQLSGLLDNALDPKMTSDPRVQKIRFCNTLVIAAEKGWNSKEVQDLLKKSARFFKIPPELLTEKVLEGAGHAGDMMERLGVPSAKRFIPVPRKTAEGQTEKLREEPEAGGEPDRFVQLTILHELSSMLLNKNLDINSLFSILLEGISRGIGMDRVLFALLGPDRRYLKGKYALGFGEQYKPDNFLTEINPLTATVFSHVLSMQNPIWVKRGSNGEYEKLITPVVDAFTGEADFFLMPVAIKSQAIGLIYADRRTTKRPLDEESFTSFRYFGQQANLCLSAIAR